MHIHDIEYSDIRVEDNMCAAEVILSTNRGTTHCACAVPISSYNDLEGLRMALLQDAIRQIMRMPEYRRGIRRITLEADLHEIPLAA